MNAPHENEQVSEAPKVDRLGDTDTESVLSQEFDRLANAEETTGESEEEEEIEASSDSEETPVDELVDDEQQAAEEQQEAEDSGYEEPAPERWPSELKEYYNKLEPEGRKLLMDHVYKPMQRTYTQTTQQLAEMRKTLDPLMQTMGQYRNDFERMGVDPQEAFTKQMAWAAHFARVGPEQGIRDMQEAYGLNGAQDKGQEEYLTPTERKMKAELDALKQQTSQVGQQFMSQQQAQQQQQYQQHVNGIRNELQSFINEQKDGKPAHPHVEKVAPAIAGIIRGGLIKNVDDYGQPISIRDQMEQAYNMACRLDPSIRTATTNKRQVKAVKNAQDANVVANTPAGQESVPNLSMTEQIEETYDKLAGRI